MNKKMICHDRQNKLYEVEADQLAFRPSIYGILIEENKVLLSRQWDGYDFPGGGVKIDETLDQALQREFFEETGLKVELIAPVYCTTSFFVPSRVSEENGKHWVASELRWNCPMIFYLVKKTGGEISKDYFDEEEKKYADLAEWISLDDLAKIMFYNSIDSKMVINLARDAL